MGDSIGKITPKRIPASQAIPGNPEHAKLMAEGRRSDQRSSGKIGLWISVGCGVVVLLAYLASNWF